MKQLDLFKIVYTIHFFICVVLLAVVNSALTGSRTFLDVASLSSNFILKDLKEVINTIT
jgi:hypothetical protein